MPKSNTAAEVVPEFVTVADLSGVNVVVVPAVTVAAVPSVPSVPSLPCGPCSPGSPLGPRGITKSNTAAVDEPTLVTYASVPASPVAVSPTTMVAAVPGSP